MSTVPSVIVAGLRAALPEERIFALETGRPEQRFDEGERREWIAEADVLVPLRGHINEQVLAIASRCRLIQQVGAGVDSVDLAAAKRRGIPVCNVPSHLGGNAESVAELALMHLIAAGRRLRCLQRSVEAEDFRVGAGISLYGKTIAIIGYGNIGRALARLLKPFGCRIITIRRHPQASASRAGLTIWPEERLYEALPLADFVVIALPLTPKTRGRIGEAEIRTCKRGVAIVNVARGALVDEHALLAALQDGHVSAAGLDVFDREPLPADHPLLRENVIATPHCGGLTDRMVAATCRLAAENIQRTLARKRPRYRL